MAKSLFQAKFGEWEKDFFIPLELINKMVLWLCSQQHNVTGEFNELPGVPVYDRNFVSAPVYLQLSAPWGCDELFGQFEPFYNMYIIFRDLCKRQ